MRFRHIACRYSEVTVRVGPEPLGGRWAPGGRVVLASREWRPALDVYETADAVVVKLELAGVREDELSVTLYADTLVVEGSRECQLPAGQVVYDTAEIQYGPFRAEVPIPGPVDADRAAGEYNCGFLEVRLPKPRGGEAR